MDAEETRPVVMGLKRWVRVGLFLVNFNTYLDVIVDASHKHTWDGSAGANDASIDKFASVGFPEESRIREEFVHMISEFDFVFISEFGGQRGAEHFFFVRSVSE